MIVLTRWAGEAATLHRRLLVLIAFAIIPAAAGAQPTPPPAPAVVAVQPGGATPGPQKVNGASPAWTVTCVSHARAVAADCAVEQRLFSKESGQLLSVAVVSVPGATRQPALVLQLPTGLALQDGASVAIDDGPAQPLAFQSCDGHGCYAMLPISPGFLAAMKAGKVMTIRAVSGNREVLVLPHMLTDFAVAYDTAR